MTLGSNPSPQDVVVELHKSWPYTFTKSEPSPWWLADKTTAQSIVFPTDFANKSAVKQVHGPVSAGGGTSHSVSGVNFGIDFDTRRIFVLIFQFGGNSASSITNVTIGGVAATGNNTGSFSGTGSLAGAGIFFADPNGTSGTISFTTASVTNTIIVVLATASYNVQIDRERSNRIDNPGGSVNIDVNNFGLLIAAYAVQTASALSFSGITERGDNASPVSGYRYGWAWNNRIFPGSLGKTVSVSPQAGEYGFEVQSFSTA